MVTNLKHVSVVFAGIKYTLYFNPDSLNVTLIAPVVVLIESPSGLTPYVPVSEVPNERANPSTGIARYKNDLFSLKSV